MKSFSQAFGIFLLHRNWLSDHLAVADGVAPLSPGKRAAGHRHFLLCRPGDVATRTIERNNLECLFSGELMYHGVPHGSGVESTLAISVLVCGQVAETTPGISQNVTRRM